MTEFENDVMVALLPTTTDWCKIELPHLTLVYAGTTDKLSVGTYNEMAKTVSSVAMLSGTIGLRTHGVEVFGEEKKVDVIRLKPTAALWSMRNLLSQWDRSEHPFRPHVTVGPQGSTDMPIPSYLTFDRLSVHWGEEQMTFRLGV